MGYSSGMSVKEQIIEKMRVAGFDFLTACEEATRCIREFLASGESSRTVYVIASGRVEDSFQLQR